MQKNRFAPASERAGAQTPRRETPQWSAAVPDYTVSPSTLFDHIAVLPPQASARAWYIDRLNGSKGENEYVE